MLRAQGRHPRADAGVLLQSIGRHPRGQLRIDGGLPVFLQGKAIAPYTSQDVREKAAPMTFRPPTGGRASGFNALLLPEVCEIFLRARQDVKLPSSQQHIARQAEPIMRGLARVGIVALVDEATGYQRLREKKALAAILERFIERELQPGVKTFPEDFYSEMFRLRDLDFDCNNVERPGYFGTLTNDIVYKRLAPGGLDELREVTPRGTTGRRKHRYFQHLTTYVGYPELREHLASVVTIMELSDDWPDFMRKLDRLHPRFGDTMELPFDDVGL